MDAFFDARIQRRIDDDQKVRADIRKRLLAAPRASQSTGGSIFISNTLTIEPVIWAEYARTGVGKIHSSGSNRISLARVNFGAEDG